jgi:hypothetical protein
VAGYQAGPVLYKEVGKCLFDNKMLSNMYVGFSNFCNMMVGIVEANMKT